MNHFPSSELTAAYPKQFTNYQTLKHDCCKLSHFNFNMVILRIDKIISIMCWKQFEFQQIELHSSSKRIKIELDDDKTD